MKGKLYGVGVGPGDCELMTLKAVRIIRECDLLLLPTEPKEECLAYRIAKGAVPEIDEKEALCRHFPMTGDQKVLDEAHDRIYQNIRDLLEEGKEIAFLTLGDPSLYSTFHYIYRKAEADRFETEIIPGVPSICAVAGKLGISFGGNKEEIHIIPGTGKVKETLEYPGMKIYMKSGKKLGDLKEELLKQKEKAEVWAVSNCGLEGEIQMSGAEALDSAAGYFTVVFVKEKISP